VPAQPGSLADRFLGRTKLDLIRLRAIIEGHEDRSMLEEAGQIAHSIHGAGAMFGFPEVGAAGAMIESLIARLRAGSDARDSVGESSLLKQLVDSVDHLARRVNAGESTPGAGMLVQHAG
jgi:chemotaxis protein histidine kinase CheA